jgi:hypothetical protein
VGQKPLGDSDVYNSEIGDNEVITARAYEDSYLVWVRANVYHALSGSANHATTCWRAVECSLVVTIRLFCVN